MIGSPDGLRLAHDAGLLPDLFKPVVRIGIERALGLSGAVGVTAAPSGRPTVTVPTAVLEASPYHDIMPNLPLNTYKNKAPLTSTIISVKRSPRHWARTRAHPPGTAPASVLHQPSPP